MTSTVDAGTAGTPTDDTWARDVESLVTVLNELANSRSAVLAGSLARLLTVVATEATKGPRFASALERALRAPSSASSSSPGPRRTNRRSPGPFDPFAVYAEGHESELRARLSPLDLEQLRDIIAEHGMDNDRLAMKWKDRERVIDRIVDRVTTRTSKGSAFR